MSRKELKTKAKAQLGNGIFVNAWLMAVVIVLIEGAITGAAGSFVVGALLITGPLTLGVEKIFLKQSRDGQDMDIVGMFDGFKDDFAGNMVLGIMETLFVLLWSLLFIIPGIVKYYGYSQAYRIKIDNPSMDWRQCLDESQKMMKGHKWELFVLDLSFIGWYIVGALCLGVGTLWVSAYHNATRAHYYKALNGEA